MQPRILYPARLPFRIDGVIRTFQNRQTLTNFVTMKPALQEILREGSIKIKKGPKNDTEQKVTICRKKDFTAT